MTIFFFIIHLSFFADFLLLFISNLSILTIHVRALDRKTCFGFWTIQTARVFCSQLKKFQSHTYFFIHLSKLPASRPLNVELFCNMKISGTNYNDVKKRKALCFGEVRLIHEKRWLLVTRSRKWHQFIEWKSTLDIRGNCSTFTSWANHKNAFLNSVYQRSKKRRWLQDCKVLLISFTSAES